MRSSTMSNQKQVDSIHRQYSEAVNKARQKDNLNAAINSLSAGDKEVIKTLGMLSGMCGGDARLSQLFSVYMQIKNNSK